MNEDEVLTTCFTYDLRLRLVVAQVVTDLAPQGVECLGRTGEVESGQIRTGCDDLTDYATLTRNEVDNTIRYTSFLEDLHQQVVGMDSCR